MNIDTILSRLDGVKSRGNHSFTARCPAHNDRSPSLSIRALDDGRILMHCFGGCSVDDIVTSIGLTLTDLFPEKVEHNKHQRAPFPAMATLKCIMDESLIILLACEDIQHPEIERIRLAHDRIRDAYKLAGGRDEYKRT